MSLLEVKHLKKVYTTRFGGAMVEALADVEFSVEEGEYVAIMGESGSGKTTLLNILAALDKPTGGKVLLNGRDMAAVPDSRMAAYRRDNLGFVFQDFNLLDTFSLRDNIFLPLVLARKEYGEMEERLKPLADRLKIKELLKRLESSEVKEVIIATDPDTEGEATAYYLSRLIKPAGIKVTRIGRGIPAGGAVGYTDGITLAGAVENRKEI